MDRLEMRPVDKTTVQQLPVTALPGERHLSHLCLLVGGRSDERARGGMDRR